jgi:regulatory protein RepA
MKLSPLNIRATLENAPPKLDFVLPGLLPGSVGTVVGAGGVGKTTFLMQLAIALSTNTEVAGGVFPSPGRPERVVLIAAEESSTILGIRLHTIYGCEARKSQLSLLPPDADKNSIALMEQNLIMIPATGHSIYLVKDGEPTKFYEDLCRFCQGARLIIIDPLRRLHDGDENSSSAMTQIVQLLESLAKKTGAAVIAAHHMNKAAAFAGVTESASASRGSSALTDAVRWQLNLSGMSDSEAKAFGLVSERGSYLRLDFSKTNYAAPHPAVWLMRREGGVLARAILEKRYSSNSNTGNRAKQNSGKDKGVIYV